MANPIHRINIVAKDKRSQRKVADSTRRPNWTRPRPAARAAAPPAVSAPPPNLVLVLADDLGWGDGL